VKSCGDVREAVAAASKDACGRLDVRALPGAELIVGHQGLHAKSMRATSRRAFCALIAAAIEPGMRLKVNMALVVSFEPEQKPIQAGMTVLDLDAALGYYTVMMARLVGAAAVRLRG
jgi:hypothetical protein